MITPSSTLQVLVDAFSGSSPFSRIGTFLVLSPSLTSLVPACSTYLNPDMSLPLKTGTQSLSPARVDDDTTRATAVTAARQSRWRHFAEYISRSLLRLNADAPGRPAPRKTCAGRWRLYGGAAARSIRCRGTASFAG